MVKREEIQGRWNEVKGRLKEHWGQLTDDELQQAKGSIHAAAATSPQAVICPGVGDS